MSINAIGSPSRVASDRTTQTRRKWWKTSSVTLLASSLLLGGYLGSSSFTANADPVVKHAPAKLSASDFGHTYFVNNVDNETVFGAIEHGDDYYRAKIPSWTQAKAKVEAVSDEDEHYQQKWKITFNEDTFAGRKNFGLTRHQYQETSRPIFSIMLSRDLDLVGLSKVTVQNREGNDIRTELFPIPGFDDGSDTSCKVGTPGNCIHSRAYKKIERDVDDALLARQKKDIVNYIHATGDIELRKNSAYNQQFGEHLHRLTRTGERDRNYEASRELLIDNAGVVQRYKYETGSRQDYKTIVEFTTERDPSYLGLPTCKANQEKETFVAAHYKSYDHNRLWLRTDILHTWRQNPVDTDKDGLCDEFEKAIGSDINDRDTDKDGVPDGNQNNGNFASGGEVESLKAQFYVGTKLWKVLGTDPTVGKQVITYPVVGFRGETLRGTTQPNKTVAIYAYKNENGKLVKDGDHPLAETVSDPDGNYKLVIGRVLKRTAKLNKFHNNIEHKVNKAQNFKIEPTMISTREKDPAYELPTITPDTKLLVEVWSDGWNKTPLFSKPTIAEFKSVTRVVRYRDIELNPKVTVANNKKLTEDEKRQIKEALKNKYPDLEDAITPGTTITPNDDGSLDLAFPDNTTLNVPAEKLIANPAPITPERVVFSNTNPTATSGVQVANGTEAGQAGTITVTDSKNKPFKNGTVQVTMPGSTTPVDVALNENGVGNLPAYTPGLVSDNKIVVETKADDSVQPAVPAKKLGEQAVTITAGDADSTNSTLSLNPTTPQEESTVTISGTVKDAAGNPITATDFDIKLPDGSIVVATTDSSGALTAKDSSKPLQYTAGEAGTAQTVGLYKNGEGATGTAIKTASATPSAIPPGPEVPANSTFKVTDSQGMEITAQNPATAGDTLTFTYTPKDNRDKAAEVSEIKVTIPGVDEPVTLTKNGDSFTGQAVVTKAGANQPVTTNLKQNADDTAGHAGKEAKIWVNPNTPTTTPAADKYQDKVTSFTAPTGTITVGDANKTITVDRLTDGYANVVTPEDGKFKAKLDGEELAITDNGNGTYSVTIPTDTAGEKSIQFEYDGSLVGGPVSVTVENPGPPYSVEFATDTVSTATAHTEVATQNNKMTIKDQQGRPVAANTKVYLKLPGSETVTEVTVGQGGKATIPAFTPDTAGSQEIKVYKAKTDDNKPSGEAIGSHSVSVAAGEPKHAYLDATENQISGTKNVEITTPGKVIVEDKKPVGDKHGNKVTSGNVYIKTPGSDNFVAVPVDAEGKADIPAFTPTGAENEKVQIASDESGENIIGEVPVVAGLGDPVADNSSISLNDDEGNAYSDTTQPKQDDTVTVKVIIKDEGNNLIPNWNMKVVLPDNTVVEARTNAQGELVKASDNTPIIFTAGVPNTVQTVKVYDGETTTGDPFLSASVTPGVNPERVTPIFTGENASTAELLANDNVVANGTDTHTVKVVLKNKFGEAVTGKAEELSLAVATDSSVSPTFASFTEDSQNPGTYTATMTATTSGDAKLTAKYGTGQDVKEINPGVLTANFKAGVPGTETTITVNPTTPKVGDTVSVTVTVKDDNGNVVAAGTKVKVTLPGADEPVAGITDENGVVHLVGEDGVATDTLPSFTATTPGTQTITVTNESDENVKTEDIAIGLPTPTDLAANATGVSGKTDKNVAVGTKVLVTDESGNTIGTGEVVANEAGEKGFRVIYVDPKPADGATISVKLKDPNGDTTSDEATTVVDGTLPSQPTIVLNPEQPGVVTGKADKGNKVTVCVKPKDSAEVTCVEAEVDEEGNYTANIDPALTTGDQVTVTATNDAGNSADSEETVDFQAPDSPTVAVTNNEDGSATITVTPADVNDIDGKPSICLKAEGAEECTPVDADDITGPAADGSYTITIPAVNRKTPITVNATVSDAKGNVSEAGTNTVDAVITKPATNVIASGAKVTGDVDDSVPVGSKVEITDEDGNLIATGEVVEGPDGTKHFEVILPEDKKPADGDKLGVTITDKNTGVVSESTEVVVDAASPAAPTDVKISEDGKTVTGKGEPEAIVNITLPDGTVVAGKVDADGSFKVELPDGKALKAGEKVSVTLVDEAGNSSPATDAIYTPKVELEPLPDLGVGFNLLGILVAIASLGAGLIIVAGRQKVENN